MFISKEYQLEKALYDKYAVRFVEQCLIHQRGNPEDHLARLGRIKRSEIHPNATKKARRIRLKALKHAEALTSVYMPHRDRGAFGE